MEKINAVLHSLLWGWPVLWGILLAGANLSFRLGFFQFTKCNLWFKKTICNIFISKKESKEGISQFQALTTALAGSIGTGNIVGVATAITIGGPGAIFWMWFSALLGMMTIFAENLLGMKYRIQDKNGQWQGGAMYYMERGLQSPFLAAIFSVGCILASLGMGNMAQANSIACSLKDTFGIDPRISGLAIAILLAIVIFGGIRRTARVTERLVPIMALGYLLAAAAVLYCNRRNLGNAFAEIFRGAFGLQPAAGGICGVAMLSAMKCGVSRGIFTNEAGLGSSSLAHSSSNGSQPVEQGMWGILQIFLDTIVMCTITALVILSGNSLSTGKDGAALSAAAFSSVFGAYGNLFISVSITLFAFATLLGWSYYGERGVKYLFGDRPIPVYRLLFAAAAYFSCTLDLRFVWDLCDTFNGFLAIPNLIALFLLSGEVVEETKRYLKKEASPDTKYRKSAKQTEAAPQKELPGKQGSNYLFYKFHRRKSSYKSS